MFSLCLILKSSKGKECGDRQPRRDVTFRRNPMAAILEVKTLHGKHYLFNNKVTLSILMNYFSREQCLTLNSYQDFLFSFIFVSNLLRRTCLYETQVEP